ncbi:MULTISPECIES: 50S ribosomal protein L23 [Acidithrix]|uniref:Large ribosomal subunit protein uL23 n=1 Tax=Acidithrix ferrooxidans TaxID=1280514 RepID=A0A0D8HKR0_9ACTN|nr:MULTISPECIES: 50S ribosomal protein L23 [Acidithrix]KJF18585.1 50S ribosomal protein L23 [Acidithrix ferrooxidans]CAG4932838.1 unnamed protein product [Acidithrix sp. C25]
MANPYSIIIKPVISEKSYGLSDAGVYTFVVDRRANKIEIGKAIEEIFSVKVGKVNTLNRKGKRKRSRKSGLYAKLSDTKHAMVTLKEGQIELFQR